MKITDGILKAGRIIGAVLRTLILLTAGSFLVMYAAGYRFYIVTTGSMEPAIHTGSLCAVDTDAGYESVKAGDIISFSAGSGMVVTHRAIEVGEKGIVTKGDANNSEDNNRVTRETYIGKTVLWIPRAGTAVTFLRSPYGIAGAAGVFILLALPIVMGRRSQDEEETPDNDKSAD